MRNLELYLKGWWRGVKNENGLLHDFSGGGNHGTITGALQVDGRDGQAMELDGVADLINIDGVVSDLASDTQGTWIAWVRTDDITATQEIISFGDTDADTRIQFDIFNNGMLRALVGEAGATKWALDTDNIVFGNKGLYHVALVQDGVSPILYVNGVAVAQAFSTDTDKTYWFGNLGGLDNGRIGCGSWKGAGNAQWFDGAEEGIQIYSTGLTVDEIEYLARRPSRSESLVPVGKMRRYFEFNETNDFLSHAADPALDIPDGYMAEAWIKPSQLVGQQRIIGTSSDISFRIDGTAIECGIFGASNFYSKSSSPALSLGNWNYILMWYDVSVDHYIHLHINGSEVSYITQDDTGGQLITTGGTFTLGATTLGGEPFLGRIENTALWNFGTDSGVSYVDYAAWRFRNPYRPLEEFAGEAWSGYKDALYTDTHDGAGSVTGLVVGMWYEFTQGTVGHNLTGGGTLSTTGVFQATATTADISGPGDASDHVRRTGVRGDWPLDSTQSFRAEDRTSNALHLTQTDPTKQPSIVHDLEMKMDTDPIFYEPLNRAKLSDKWTVASGTFEPIYDSSELHYGIKCLTAGVIGIPVLEQLHDLAKQNVEFSCKIYKADASELSINFIADSIAATPTGYRVQLKTDESLVLNETGVGDLTKTGASYFSAARYYLLAIRHSAAGVFSLYWDGAKIPDVDLDNNNDVTDTTTQASSYIVIEADAGDIVADVMARRY